MTVYIAMLRGINVTGHNKVAMKDLRALFEALPAEDVKTYVQSGNVVFESHAVDATGIALAAEARIRTRLGLTVTVVVRTSDEFNEVLSGNPLLADRDPAFMHVTFLAASPDGDRVAALEAGGEVGAPDEFRLLGRQVYLYCPNGYGRTKLNNAFFERKLAVAATTRNWRTVTNLAALTRG
ncbi:MAG: hypothetical protein QOJ52_649 [Acidimicrobiaceae bacterium]|jgi:uncharacterized protein (DUF1697 family)|nr:hypothetical protein [Acidimicrobiaceae bacterium]